MSQRPCISLPLWVTSSLYFDFLLWVEVNFVSWHQNSESHSHWVSASPQIPNKNFFTVLFLSLWMFLCISLSWCKVTHVCQLHLSLKSSHFVVMRPWAVGKALNNTTYYCLLLLYETVTVWVRLIHWFFLIFGPKQLEKNITGSTLLMWNVNVTFCIMSTPCRPILLFLSLFSLKTLLSMTVAQHNSSFSIRFSLIILRVPSRHIILCIMKSQHLCVISFFSTHLRKELHRKNIHLHKYTLMMCLYQAKVLWALTMVGWFAFIDL